MATFYVYFTREVNEHKSEKVLVAAPTAVDANRAVIDVWPDAENLIAVEVNADQLKNKAK